MIGQVRYFRLYPEPQQNSDLSVGSSSGNCEPESSPTSEVDFPTEGTQRNHYSGFDLFNIEQILGSRPPSSHRDGGRRSSPEGRIVPRRVGLV